MTPKHTFLHVDLGLYTHFILISKFLSVALIIIKLSILQRYDGYHGHVSIAPYPLNCYLEKKNSAFHKSDQ